MGIFQLLFIYMGNIDKVIEIIISSILICTICINAILLMYFLIKDDKKKIHKRGKYERKENSDPNS